MKGHEWIWIVVLFGIGVGLWLLVKPVDSFTKKVKPQRGAPTCSTDPPPVCEPDLAGGWGKCKDAQGPCKLSRGCGTMLNCINSFTCADALGPCIWY